MSFAFLLKLHNTAVEKAGLHKYKQICCGFNPARVPSSRACRVAADPPADAGSRNTMFFTPELSPGMLSGGTLTVLEGLISSQS